MGNIESSAGIDPLDRQQLCGYLSVLKKARPTEDLDLIDGTFPNNSYQYIELTVSPVISFGM